MQDAVQIKERIISVLRNKGPSLPIQIAKVINTTTIFTSAFLSELISEKMVKMSHMRVGSSPVYFLDGQEGSLEQFSLHLKSREKDAFLLLKEKKFLRDSEQLPAIRVALRQIKDFAIPLKSGEELFWRYYTAPESDFVAPLIEAPKMIKAVIRAIPEPVQVITAPLAKAEEEIIKTVDDNEKPTIKEKPIKERAKKSKVKKQSQKKPKKDDGFFAKVKDFVYSNQMELLDIENFGKKEIVLRIKDGGEEKLLIAYNKNKITENDIINASRRASELNLQYVVVGMGEPLKKLSNLMEALKGMSSLKRINKP